MSTTVESRVVEMRFDNKHFERNVSNTMSTLDKLKAKLNFSGSAKGLNDVNAAAKNVDMNGLAKGVETVSARFSALQVMGVTTLANLTNSAVNAGKRIASALTIDPITTGFSEYETQINAVQTILANTESKGTTIDDVNKALEELNQYADKTIYNFTEMTRNIGTFTAAGVDLDTSVSAIQGIANLAAVSGSTSQQASTAMYQLSQALATGTVKLQDWNSVVNAGMGGEVFQNALKRTAKTMGTDVDALIKKYGSFRDSLTQGEWLTTEILTKTLNQFTMAAEEGSKEWNEFKKSLMDEGYTEKQAEEILKMANTATDAATKVKTFTQLWDVLKESAQSGWSQTWKLLIGDFEEAKSVLTPLADALTGIINKTSDFRNKVLEGALGRGFSKLSEQINGLVKPAAKAMDTVKETVETVADFGDIVNEVISGNFGNGIDRFNALSEAGINYYEVQNKVNEELGCSKRYTQDQIDAQNKLLGIQSRTTDTTKKNADAQSDLTEEQTKQIAQLAKLSEAELKALGYSEEQIAAFKELASTAEKLGMPIDEFINKMDEIDGRWLMIESFKNVGKGLVDVFKAIKQAWADIFPPKSIEERSEQLFNVIAAMHKFSRSLAGAIYQNGKLTETGDKLVRTLKGVFAVVDIITSVVGGAFKTAFKIVTELLGRFDLHILDITANVGDAVVGFRDWLKSIVNISDVVDFLVPIVKTAAEHIAAFFNAVKDSDELSSFVRRIEKIGAAIRDWIKDLKGSGDIPGDIIAGLAKGIREGAPEMIAAMFDLAKSIITGICEALGIHSPSKVMIAIGGFIIAGLVVGLQNGTGELWTTLKDIGLGIIDWFKNLDFGTVFGVGISIALYSVFKNIANAMNVLAAPFEGFGEMCEKIGEAFDGLKSTFKAAAWEKRARAILTFALAIGVLAASIYVLSKIDTGKLWGSIAAIAALATIIAVLAIAIGKLGPTEGLELGKFSLMLLGMSGSLLLVSTALKKLSSIDSDAMSTGVYGLTYVVMAMMALMAATSIMGTGIEKVGGTLIKMSIVMLLMIHVVKRASGINAEDAIKGGVAIAAFIGIMAAMALVTRLVNKDNFGQSSIDKIGGMLIKMSIAMMLMIAVIKLASGLDASTAIKGASAIAVFIGIMAAMIKITQFAGNTEKLGRTLLAMASAMLIMAFVVKILAGMSAGDLLKGVIAIAAFGGIVIGLMAATNLATKDELQRVGSTILMLSISIGILAAVASILGLLNLKHLAKGVTAVAILGGIMTAMIWATRGANDCKSNLIVMTVAIGLLVASVAALSLIDTDKLISASAALSLVLGMFAVIVKSSSAANGSISTLIVMVGAVAVLAGVLYILASLPIEASLSASVALSTLLLAITTSLTILSMAGPAINMALSSIGIMTGIVAALGVILVCLSGLPVKSTLATAISLTALLLAMVGALAIASVIGPMATTALTALGIMTGIIAALGVILVCLSGLPIKSTLVATTSLSALLVTMASVCALVSFIPAAAALNGALGLAAFVGVMAVVLAALGGLMLIPGVNELMSGGGKLLGAIGYAIGNFVGSIIGGLSAGVTSGLPDLGTNLSMFMNNAGDFISGITQLDPDLLTRVKTFADAIDVLSGAAERSAQSDFSKWLFGDNSIATFSGQLETVGTNISAFVSALTANGAFTDDAVSSVKVACEILNAMAEAANSANGQADWSKSLFGDNSLTAFGSQFGTLGTNLSNFVTNLTANGTFNETTVKTVRCAGDAIKSLADAASTIPNDGGWAAKIFGDNSLATFGTQLPTLGTNLNGFATNLGKFDESTVSTVTCAANAIKAMSQAASGIDGQAEWAKKLFGDNSLASFGTQLGSLGTNLKAFASNLGTFTDGQVSTVNSAVKAIKALSNLADADLKGAKNNLGGFGDKLGTFGADLKAFISDMPSSDSVNSAVSGIRNILSATEEISAANTGALGELAANLKKVGGDAVNKFVSAFTSNTAKTNVKDAADALADKAVDGLDGLDDDAETAGKDLGRGLVRGIKSKKQAAYDAGYALGQAAVQGEKDGQKSKSPSKLTIQAGKWLGEGLIIGIDNMSRAVYKSGYALGGTAVDSISATVSKIADVVSSDIDAQPTIAPVLDLSNIRTGVAAIDDMLGVGSTVGVLATANGISTSMNARSQNGSNAEVVSAINRLRKDLGNVGNTYYNIDGVTYDDGSNIAGAVKEITRYARMERRA